MTKSRTTLSQGLSQLRKASALFAQKPSGSSSERSYMAWYVSALIWAS